MTSIVKQYEEVITTQKKIKLLLDRDVFKKKSRTLKLFFEMVQSIKYTILKWIFMSLQKKYPHLQNSTLSANYLQNNFKKMKSVCKKMEMNLSRFLSFSPAKGFFSCWYNFILMTEYSPSEIIFSMLCLKAY